jgi:hypothetical protein
MMTSTEESDPFASVCLILPVEIKASIQGRFGEQRDEF